MKDLPKDIISYGYKSKSKEKPMQRYAYDQRELGS